MDALLINMPASSIRPPLGISLLKACLAESGLQASVYNANISFARRIGIKLYHYIAEIAPSEILIGDWLFSDNPQSGDADIQYLQYIQDRFPNEVPHDIIHHLLAAKAEVPGFLDEALEVALSTDCQLLGFTSSFAQTMASSALSRRIKSAYPDCIIALGGANCESTMGLALHQKIPDFDLVFCGEADISFPAAVNFIKEGAPPTGIRGMVWRAPDSSSQYVDLTPDRVKNLDDLPFPDYDDFFTQYRTLDPGSRIAGIPMETSRGCWWGEKHHCTFCGLNGMSMQYRVKSPERALAEIDYLSERYKADDVQMVDNILDMRYTTSLLPVLASRDQKFSLFYETKSNLTAEQLALFRSAGIIAIQVGIESLDSRILQIMKKGLTGIRAIEVLKNCRELGIWPHWNILYGFPGEPEDAYDQMADTISALTHLDPPNVCMRLRLDRFSPLFTSNRAPSLPLLNDTPREMINIRPTPAYSMTFGLPTSALDEIAYYFDYDYVDGRLPEAYTERLRKAVCEWQTSATGDLTVEDNGTLTRVVDTRNGGWKVHLLSGVERDLYLRCRRAASLKQAAQGASSLMSTADVADLFAKWIYNRIMIGLDGRYLSLAVDRTVVSRARRRKPTWSDVIRQSTEASSGSSRDGIFGRSRKDHQSEN
jgi:ribosomal peptide maturation radical SAM protein 1